MKKRLTFSLTLALLLVSRAAPSGSPRPDVSADEYKIYSAVVMKNYVEEDTRLAVITDETYDPVPDGDSARVLDGLGKLHFLPSAETWDDFVAQNRKGEQKLGRSFSLGVNYVIVDYKSIEGLFEPAVDLDEAWKKFYRQYPRSNGYFRVSRVGFNRAQDQALVHTSWMCNQRCGEGRYVLLVKRDGEWKVEDTYTQWVS
jgi:hypothetical protein